MTLEPSRRSQLLRTCFDLRERIGALEASLEDAPEDAAAGLETELSSTTDEIHRLYDEYRESLPLVPIGSCPFCGRLNRYAMDSQGLDGLWWSYANAVRSDDHELCPHFLALTGAVTLNGKVDAVPFLAKPGPEVPFVLPRILSSPSVLAVVSRLSIGHHTGYPVCYFASEVPADLELVNDWGSNGYVSRAPGREGQWGESFDTEDDLDFELERWLAGGKLLWVDTGAANGPLRKGGKCPFVGLPGGRRIVRIQDGETWSDDDDVEEDDFDEDLS